MVTPGRAAYGFEVRSPRPLRFLRRGGGGESLHVLWSESVGGPPAGPPVANWHLRDGERTVRASLYRQGAAGALQLEVAGGMSCLIDAGARTIRVLRESASGFAEPALWGLPALLCFMERGDFSLHAAAVEVHGGAVLLGGPGRVGKTTLALAFHSAGYRVLSEDLACCRLTPQPAVLPGPAILRLRPDMFDGAAPPGTRHVATRPDRVYLELDDERCGSGHPVPIKAIVLLHQSGHGIELERLSGASALPLLWALTFPHPLDAAVSRRFGELCGLVAKIPVWNLRRPLSRDALEPTVARVVRACAS